MYSIRLWVHLGKSHISLCKSQAQSCYFSSIISPGPIKKLSHLPSIAMILINIHNNCHIARSICQFLDLMFPELWAPFKIIGHLLGFPDSSVGKECACHAGNSGSIPGPGRSPGEGIGYPHQCSWASLVAQLVKNPPAMRETWVRSLGWEDPLENGNAIHSSILAWRIKESDTTERLSLSTLISLDFQDFTLSRFNPTSLVTVSQAFVQNPLLHPDLSML